MPRARLLLICFVFLSASFPARADQLVFKNGDRWTGTLVSMQEGKVKFRTELVGELTVPFSRVDTLSADQPVEIHMSDGTVVVDAVASADAGSFRTLGQAMAGEQLFPLAETVAINPKEAEWTGKLLAGSEFERGNSIKDSAYVELNAGFDGKRHRMTLRASYDGERTTDRDTKVSTTQDRNLFGRMMYEYLFSERNFWYVSSSGEKDGPSNLDLRFIAGTGLGRDIFKRPGLRLKVYAGPTFVSENFSDDTSDEQRAAGTLGWDGLYEIIPDLDFFTDGTYTMASGNDIIVRSQVGLRNDLTKRLFLEGKILWEYDSQPAGDAERQDVDYILGLGYSF